MLTLLHSGRFRSAVMPRLLVSRSRRAGSTTLDQLLVPDSSRCASSSSTAASSTAVIPRCARSADGRRRRRSRDIPLAADDSIYLHLPENPSPSLAAERGQARVPVPLSEEAAPPLENALTSGRGTAEVAEVGRALSTFRDHSVLLTMILSKAREPLARGRWVALPPLRSRRRQFCVGSWRRTTRSTSRRSSKKSCRSRASRWPATCHDRETLVIDDA